MALEQLSKDIQSRLRSGVAITSVAQAVEELVLNSIDADATCVAVRIDMSCCKIQVVDNGRGITREQLEKVAERYTTSKCHSLQDLDERLQHFGYRGEALASMRDIASVLDIESRTRQCSQSFTRLFQFSKPHPVTESKTHRPSAGTTITVYDLFNRLPVRQKGLNQSLELERARQRIEAIALIHPNCSFSLRNDVTGTKILQTHKSNSVLGAFNFLFGGTKSRTMSPLTAEAGSLKLHGFMSREGHHNKNMQFIFLNNRLVLKTKIHRLINFQLSRSSVTRKRVTGGTEGSPKWAPPGVKTNSPPRPPALERHGVFVINITCPLDDYDITYDPAKTLVEFKSWRAVMALVGNTVDSFLKEHGLVNILDTEDLQKIPEELEEAQEEDSQEDGSPESAIFTSLQRYAAGIHTTNAANNLASKTVFRPREGPSADEIVEQIIAEKTQEENQKKDNENRNTEEAELPDEQVPGDSLKSTAEDKLVSTNERLACVMPVNNSESPLAFMYNTTQECKVTPSEAIKTQIPHSETESQVGVSSTDTVIKESVPTPTPDILHNSPTLRYESPIPMSAGSESESLLPGTRDKTFISLEQSSSACTNCDRALDNSVANTSQESQPSIANDKPSMSYISSLEAFKSSLGKAKETKSGQIASQSSSASDIPSSTPDSSHRQRFLLSVSEECKLFFSNRIKPIGTNSNKPRPSTEECSSKAEEEEDIEDPLSGLSSSVGQNSSHKLKRAANLSQKGESSQSSKTLGDFSRIKMQLRGDTGQGPSTESTNCDSNMETQCNSTDVMKSDLKKIKTSNTTTASHTYKASSLKGLDNLKETLKGKRCQREPAKFSCSFEEFKKKIREQNKERKTCAMTSRSDTKNDAPNAGDTGSVGVSQKEIAKSADPQIVSQITRQSNSIEEDAAGEISEWNRKRRSEETGKTHLAEKLSRLSRGETITVSKRATTVERQSFSIFDCIVDQTQAALSRGRQTTPAEVQCGDTTATREDVPGFHSPENCASDVQETEEKVKSRATSVNVKPSTSSENSWNDSPLPKMTKDSITSNEMSRLEDSPSLDRQFYSRPHAFGVIPVIPTWKKPQKVLWKSPEDESQGEETLAMESNSPSKHPRLQPEEWKFAQSQLTPEVRDPVEAEKLQELPESSSDGKKSDTSTPANTELFQTSRDMTNTQNDEVLTKGCENTEIKTGSGDEDVRLSELSKHDQAHTCPNENPAETVLSPERSNTKLRMQTLDYTIEIDPLRGMDIPDMELSYSQPILGSQIAEVLQRQCNAQPEDSPSASVVSPMPSRIEPSQGFAVRNSSDIEEENTEFERSQCFQVALESQGYSMRQETQSFTPPKQPADSNVDQGEVEEKTENSKEAGKEMVTDSSKEKKENHQQSSKGAESVKTLEKTLFVGPSWVVKLDPNTGRKIFINKITGHSSFNTPPQSKMEGVKQPVFHLKNTTLPSGATPPIQCGSSPLLARPRDQRSRQTLEEGAGGSISHLSDALAEHLEKEEEVEATKRGIKWRNTSSLQTSDHQGSSVNTMFEEWDNPVFTNVEECGVNVDARSSAAGASRVQQAIQPYKFDKSIFSNVKILGQLDNKFIACQMMLPPSGMDEKWQELLTVIDQHAAHERVRLEQLTADAYTEDGLCIDERDLDMPVTLVLTEEEVRVACAYHSALQKKGLSFRADSSKRNLLHVYRVPTCLTMRDLGDQKRKRVPVSVDLLEAMFREETEILSLAHGAGSTIPRTVFHALCSQACHGAIKFGDPLSRAECEDLVKQLSMCKLPFQCAHGRPAVMPILDLGQLKVHQTKTPPIKLWKLRQSFQEKEGQ